MSVSWIIDMSGLIAPALIAGLLVASTHVPLGREVLRRGIIFLDLAVAQIAALCAIASSVFFGWEGIGGQATAFAGALSAAFIFSRLEAKGQAMQEALIGCSFVIAASLAILLFANDPHGGEEVNNLLAGQILWVSWQDIAWMAAVYMPVLFVQWRYPDVVRRHFYIVFAACITVSVQIVGVYLVFASLVVPAMAMQARDFSLRSGYIIACVAVMAGLTGSALSDLPSGPLMVCTYALAAIAAVYACRS